MQAITKVFSDIVKPYIDTVKQVLTDQVNNDGCKNHFGMSLSNVVNNGITYQVDENNIITANGTVTTSPSSAVGSAGYITGLIVGKTYVLSGLPELTALSGGEAFIKLYKNDNSYSEIKTSSGNKTLTFTYDGTNAKTIDVGIRTVGTVVTNAVFKPMICLKSLYDADPTFAPYAKSNKELTEDVDTINNNAFLEANSYCINCSASSGDIDDYGRSLGIITSTSFDQLITLLRNGGKYTSCRIMITTNDANLSSSAPQFLQDLCGLFNITACAQLIFDIKIVDVYSTSNKRIEIIVTDKSLSYMKVARIVNQTTTTKTIALS